MWYKELAIKHFENSANIQKGRYPIVVMAEREGDVGRIDIPGDLPMAKDGDKFYLISGQHRVHAMNHIIESRLVGEKGSTINHLEVLQDPDAEWPAEVYRSGKLRHQLIILSPTTDMYTMLQNLELQTKISSKRLWILSMLFLPCSRTLRPRYGSTVLRTQLRTHPIEMPTSKASFPIRRPFVALFELLIMPDCGKRWTV